MFDYPLIKIRFNRRKTATRTQTASVEIEISYLRNRKWFSTGVRVLIQQWSESAQRVVNHYDQASLNERIYALHRTITGIVNDIVTRGDVFSFDLLDAALDRGHVRGSFIEYAEKRIDERGDLRESTRRTQRKLISALHEFKKISTFSSVTKTNILAFDDWLHAKGITQSTVHSYHKFLKTYIHDAMAHGMLDRDPYVGVKISRGKSRQREHLSAAELARLRECDKLPEALHKVRDMFLLQCFTGLAYSDLMKNDFSDLKSSTGRKVLTGQRVKTGENYYVVLVPDAVEILERYDYEMPRMSLQQYNMRLKAVADISGINKTLTSHVGRHTAACLMLNHGVPMEVVKEVLGHTDIKTTQIYAHLVNVTVNAHLARYERELERSMAHDSAKG